MWNVPLLKWMKSLSRHFGAKRAKRRAGLRLQWELRIWKILGEGRGPLVTEPKILGQDKVLAEKRSRRSHLFLCGNLSQPGAGRVGEWGRCRARDSETAQLGDEASWSILVVDRNLEENVFPKWDFTNVLGTSPQDRDIPSRSWGKNGRTASLPNQ